MTSITLARIRKAYRSFFAVVMLVAILASGARTQQSQWPKVQKPPIPDSLLGISGMALWKDDDKNVYFIVVHDAKSDADVTGQPAQPRAGILVVSKPVSSKDKASNESKDKAPDYIPLLWPADDKAKYPNDLEAITAVPDSNPKTFIALTSKGKCYHIKLEGTQVVVIKSFPLKSVAKADNDYEGFALQKLGGSVFAFWAHRGWKDEERPALLFWSTFDTTNDSFGPPSEKPEVVTVTFPKPCVRHISDIKVDEDGEVFISSAQDCNTPGNTKFESAAYEIGRFNVMENKITFLPIKRPLLPMSEKYKIEALELMPGPGSGFIFGTDDEDAGGSIYVQWQAGLPQPTPGPTRRN